MKEKRKSEPEPEPHQHGPVPQHCLGPHPLQFVRNELKFYAR